MQLLDGRLKRATLIILPTLFLLSSCGGGGGSSSASLIAAAGPDITSARNATVTLDGSGSSAGALTYRWEQTKGPDVTGGAGFLSGVTPSFTTPDTVDTVSFSLTVNDGSSTSAANTVHVNVLEHSGPSFFIDSDEGSDDSGDGSMSNPFASIQFALSQISDNNIDLYIKRKSSSGIYDETGATLELPTGTSLYGGYGNNWIRDTDNYTRILGNAHAISISTLDDDAWISGIHLTATAGEYTSNPVTGISAISGNASLVIENNTIDARDVEFGISFSPGGSYGLRLANLDGVEIRGNTISAGDGGHGAAGGFKTSGAKGGDGGNASGSTGGASGAAGNPNAGSNIGGRGGNGGASGGGNGADGGDGCALSDSDSCNGIGTSGTGGRRGDGGGGSIPGVSERGDAGSGGAGGLGGTGGDGGDGGILSSDGFYLTDNGSNGQTGNSGEGGGGGGGGEGGAFSTGGGGGGGGGGGRGGEGGSGGPGGGASIGITVHNIANVVIDNNTISSANGGGGGASGQGGFAGVGGDGGNGSTEGANGGHGGGGGRGGRGGEGGGGAGGPSFTILVGANMSPIITNNTLVSADGGDGGARSNSNGGGIGGSNGEAGASGEDGGAGGDTSLPSKAGDGSPVVGGSSYGIFDFDPSDGQIPTVDNNTISFGTPGLRGSAGEQNF
jgi:hypothetical protein